ncbi:hypothetical protein P171DRAFT_430508 [Karstenula rhodostoma CBS 690.94]|uniref:Secreted protein n=1 Tax=Karstenula rhodostoma CBS 690.94 TaxID=1392251 RepID=A0A9P4PNE1_9PLEO|nr:hypothetical protein P171DRAFT_430508 [Karstenula rhodostoma CBS 690.94]
MLLFRFLFLISTSAACKCFHKTTPFGPSKYATAAACQEAHGKMRYFPDGGFDCNAHTMSNRLRKFSIWCRVYGNCSDCRCPHGCSNRCPNDVAMFGDDTRDETEDDEGDFRVTVNGMNAGTENEDVGDEGKSRAVVYRSFSG